MGVTTSSNSAATYEPISTTTLGSNTNTTSFNSITGSYTDLILVSNVLCTTVSATIYLRFNSDTGTNYSVTAMDGTGSAAESWRVSNDSGIELLNRSATMNGSNPVMCVSQIMNYSNATTYKTAISRYNGINTSSETTATVGLWRNTNAINSVTIYATLGNFQSGSTFTLYGIKAA